MYQHWEDLAANKNPYSGCKWDKCEEVRIYLTHKKIPIIKKTNQKAGGQKVKGRLAYRELIFTCKA